MDWLRLSQAYRVSMPRQERRHFWLGPLLDALAVVDASVAQAVARAREEAGRLPGCGGGCHSCCHQPIPVTPAEIMGLRLFVTEEMKPSLRDQLAAKAREDSSSCHFLLRGACAAYPLRPMACRRYVVLGEACAPGEDCTATRPGDVLQPSRDALREAMRLTLPAYARGGENAPAPDDPLAFAFALTVPLASISGDILGSPASPFSAGLK